MLNQPSQHGAFTLLEVLVSLIILAVGIMGIMAAVLAGSHTGSATMRLEEAVTIAQRELELATSKPTGELTAATGSSGYFHWTVNYANKPHNLVLASVNVQWHEQGEPRDYGLMRVFAPQQ